jgi:histone deacetylase 1/2
VNTASRGRGRGRGRGRSPGRGASSSSGRGFSYRQESDDQDDGPLCQLCERPGHTIHYCWHRFNKKFVPPSPGVGRSRSPGPQKSVSSIAPTYGVDTNWYLDSGATDNITNDLERLSTHDRYNGHDQVHAANGKGMRISHIGNSIVHTPQRDFSIKNVLHVPSANKNLISIHQFTSANDVFLEFHPNFFYIKDVGTKNLLLQGSCQDGLYPMPTFPQVHHINKPSTSIWHHRLGHPSSVIVNRVLRDNNLSFSKESCQSVCDACQ